MLESTFDLEKKLVSEGYGAVIGIDEAGRGPLAGPVVAAAALPRNFECLIHAGGQFSAPGAQPGDQISKEIGLIRDSKTLSAKQREKMMDFIGSHFFVGIGICDHRTIDRINILEATFLAAKMAISDLLKKREALHSQAGRTIILFDGNKPIPNLSHEQRAVTDGDRTVKSISAASIAAKVTRDRLMLDLHRKFPHYGFDRHKGYGTSFHLEMIQKHGPCEIHRRSFEPMASLAKREKW